MLSKKYVFVILVLIVVIVGESYVYMPIQKKYNALQVDHSSLQDQITILNEQVEIQYVNGYAQGVTDSIGHGYALRDPTYREVISFLSANKVDENIYVVGIYVCQDFAADVINAAFEVGYRCAYVAIRHPVEGHAVICFDTVDLGLLFIEPQDDRIVSVVVGQPYWDRTYYAPSYDDTVVRFIIIW